MELYKSHCVIAVQSIWLFLCTNNSNNYVSVVSRFLCICIYKLLQIFIFAMRNYIDTFHNGFCSVVIALLVHNIQYNNDDDDDDNNTNMLYTFLTQG